MTTLVYVTAITIVGYFFLKNAGNRRMTQNASFVRKIVYGCAIVVLLFPLFLLGQPATSSVDWRRPGRQSGIEWRRAGSDACQLRAVAS